MQALFEQANAEEYTANAIELQVILQKCQQDRTTGAVQVSSPKWGELQFLLSHGDIVSIRAQTMQDPDGFAAESWKNMLEEADSARVRVVVLPPPVLRLARLLGESGNCSKVETTQTSKLGELIDLWRGPLGPSLLHLGWSGAEAIMVLPPTGGEIRDAIFVSAGNSIEIGREAGDKARAWTDGSCIASLFPNQVDSQAWQDYRLHDAFVSLSERLIARYEQFAGRILVGALGRDIAVTADREHWDIAVREASIDDRIFLRTPAEAAVVYRTVVGIIRHHMSVVLGNKRMMSIIAEAMVDIPSGCHELVQRYALLEETRPSRGMVKD